MISSITWREIPPYGALTNICDPLKFVLKKCNPHKTTKPLEPMKRSMCGNAVRTMLTVGQSGVPDQGEAGTGHAGKPAYCTGNCQRCPGRQNQSCQALIEVERRSELRRRYTVDISAFQVDLETFGTSHTWSSVDRSSGGMGVRSNHPVEVGSTYVIGRCDQTSFSRVAKVVRCEPQVAGYTIGLQWKSLFPL